MRIVGGHDLELFLLTSYVLPSPEYSPPRFSPLVVTLGMACACSFDYRRARRRKWKSPLALQVLYYNVSSIRPKASCSSFYSVSCEVISCFSWPALQRFLSEGAACVAQNTVYRGKRCRRWSPFELHRPRLDCPTARRFQGWEVVAEEGGYYNVPSYPVVSDQLPSSIFNPLGQVCSLQITLSCD